MAMAMTMTTFALFSIKLIWVHKKRYYLCQYVGKSTNILSVFFWIAKNYGSKENMFYNQLTNINDDQKILNCDPAP